MSLEVSPRSAARARLKQKHNEDGAGAGAEPWKKRYDLAVKQSLGLRLSTPQASSGASGFLRSSPQRKNHLIHNNQSSPTSYNPNLSSATGIEIEHQQQHQDMDEMLDPSFEAEGNCIESTTSSADDSIIRRVEEEIAAARKAASGMNRKLRSPKQSSGGGLPIVLHLPGGVAETISPSASSSASSSEDSSKHRALEMIQDEFQDEAGEDIDIHKAFFPSRDQTFNTDQLNETQGGNSGIHIEVVYSRQNTPAAAPSDQLFFTDEEWQVGPSPSDGLVTASTGDASKPSLSSSLSMDHSSDAFNNSNNNSMMEQQQQQKDCTKNTFNSRLVNKHLQAANNEHQAAPDDEEMEDRQGEVEEQPVPNSPTNHKESTFAHTLQQSTSLSPASSKRDSPASSVVESRNKDPDGVYSGPKDVISGGTPTNKPRDLSSLDVETTDIADHTTAVSSSLSTVSRSSQQKTRELLDNLREQREAMATPRRASGTGADASSSPLLILSSPRSSTTMTRATRARERVKTASRVRAMPRADESSATLDSLQESPVNDNTTTIDSMSPPPPPPPPMRNPSPRIPSSRPATKESPRWNNKNSSPLTNHHTADNDMAQPPVSEIDEAKRAKRIRFRNPFPVIKNPNSRRDAAVIAQDHSLGIQDMPIRWIKPKQELKQLIVAAMGTSLPRRSNACGALKVLTQQRKNQLALVRTDGFLSALILAASQSLLDIDRDLAIDARTRAVNCLKNVAAPKDNRVMMMNHPGVLECLVKVIKTDGNEGRALATATVAVLAKTPSCREGLAHVDGLIDVISKVLHGEAIFPIEESSKIQQPLSDNSAVRRKLNDSVSDFSTQSGSRAEEENQENIKEVVTQEFQKDADSAVVAEESSDDGEGTDYDEDDEEYAGQPPVEISHKKASPQLDSIRNKLEVRHQEFVNQSRANACAILLHLSRQCTISPQLCSSRQVLYSLASVAREVTVAIHSKCLEVICNLSRFPQNNITITNYEGMIDLLVAASSSAPSDNRLNALRTLQNLSADPPSKRYLATTQVLNLMTSCAMRKDPKEKEVAVATIYNITTEPSAVTAITNTKNVVATLVHLAHSPDSSSTIRLLACEALATISLWLQTLAGTGSIPDGVSGVPLPSQKTSGWERWD